MPFIYLSAVIFSTFLLFISLFYLACLKIYNNNKEWKFEFETDTRFPLVLHNCSRNIKITKTNVKMWKLKDKATDRTQDKEVPIVICRERERERKLLHSFLPPSPWAPPHSHLRRHEPLSSSLLKHLPFTNLKTFLVSIYREQAGLLMGAAADSKTNQRRISWLNLCVSYGEEQRRGAEPPREQRRKQML